MHQQEQVTDNELALPVENDLSEHGQKEDGPTAEAPINPVVKSFRDKFCTDPLRELIAGLGEDPMEYEDVAESLLEDLQPRPGLEAQLVDQMGQALWRMRRAQRIQDGLALQRLHLRRDFDELAKAKQADDVYVVLEPWERLQAVLSRRRNYPTPEEIDEFLNTRKGEAENYGEFIALLKSMKTLTDPDERKSALKQARARLREHIEPLQNAAWRMGRRLQEASSAENLAALMAPEGKSSAIVAQRMEDAQFRRLCRLTQVFSKVRNGALQEKKMLKIPFKAGMLMKTKERP